MSDNRANQAVAGGGPACEGESLIVEVMGKNHPEGQKFSVFRKSVQDQKEPVNTPAKTEVLTQSVLHVWPWKGEGDGQIYIEIDAEGAPIEVPLLESCGSIKRERPRQKHVVLPVIPATLISGVELRGNNPTQHVLSRAGFLYLFHKGKLWRELEIRIDEKGVARYHDAPIQKYREENGQLSAGYREVTGTGLEEIWLPARADGRWLTIEAAYSEAQWPGERVNHLERADKDRKERCNQINLAFDTEGKEDVENLKASSGKTTAFLATALEAQRPRKPAVEWQYDRPEKYLLDLEGKYPEAAMATALSMHQRQEDPDPEDPVAEDERPEMNALANCLHRTLKEVEGGPEEDAPFEWSDSEGQAEDSTETAKKRRIGVIRIDDPLYSLRYNQQRRLVAAWFSTAAVRRARARPFFDSAMLVNAVIEPEAIAGEPNKLHKHITEIGAVGRKEFERSIALSERQMSRRYLDSLHSDLLYRLSDSRTQQVLVDLFTHAGYDYAGAFRFVSSQIMNLVTEPKECDALDMHAEDAADGKGKQWLQDLCEGKGSQLLHSLLFPRFTPEDLEKPYEVPSEPSLNHGNGRFRETELAALENTDIPELDDIQTIDGLEVAMEAAAGSYTTVSTANLRLGAQTLMAIHGNMWVAIHHASQAVEGRNTELKKIRQELEGLRLEKSRLENEYWRNEKSINNLSGKEDKLREIQNKLVKLEDQRADLLRMKQKLDKEAILGRMALYSKSMEQLRRSLPGLLGNMELMRLSKALQQDYFIFEISSRQPDRMGNRRAIRLFGDVFQAENAGDPDSKREMEASTNKKRAKPGGIAADVAEDVYVLALPKTEEIARMIADTSAAESRFRDAVHKLTELEELADLDLNTPGAAAAMAANRLEAAKAEATEAERALKQLERDIENQRGAVQGKENYIRDVEAANDAANRIDQAEIDSKKTSRLYRVLNKPVFPVFVGMLELHNASSVWAGLSKEARVKGFASAGFGAFSSGFDVLVAGTAITERWILGPSRILSLKAPGDLGAVFERLLGTNPTIRAGLGAAAGFLMAIDCGMEAVYQYRMGNMATAVGNGLMAGSGLAFGFSGLVGKAGTFLVLGPKGWLVAAVVLAGSGLAMVFAFSDEPLEIWMRHGPFGPLNEKPFLKDPGEAYYRLISLLMGVSVRLEFNPLRRPAREGTLKETDKDRLHKLATAKERLVVESAIPGLFNANGMVDTIAKLQLTETVAVSKGRNARVYANRTEGEAVKEYLLLEEESESGVYLYLDTPLSERKEIESRFFWEPDGWKTSTYQWSAKIQIHTRKREGEKLMVFPAPPPDDPRSYNEEHSQPDFNDGNQPFWYNQKVIEDA